MKYIVYVLMSFLMISCESFSIIQGRIVDKNTKQPIEDVYVYGKVITLESHSDSLGMFKIFGVGRKFKLCFSKEGYEEVSLKKKAKECFDTITIELYKDTLPSIENTAK